MTSTTLGANEHHQSRTNPAWCAINTGFGGALIVGVVSWAALLFDRTLPLAVVGAICAVAYMVWCLRTMRHLQSRSPQIGIISGAIAFAASFVFTGSLFVKQPETLAALEGQQNQFDTQGIVVGALILGAFVILSAFAGMVAPRPNATTPDCRARFAWICAASYLPLLVVGGVVTGTESGLAVPDAVTTYGSISILFPLSLMDEPRIYLEHSHRIFGTFAGFATIVLTLWMLIKPARLQPRLMSVVLLLGVIVQGIMGALRVSEESQALAALHGVLAQLVFALAIMTGIAATDRWYGASCDDEHRSLAKSARLFFIIAGISIIIQLVFGSLTRHTESSHPLISHVGFSFVVVVLTIIAGAKAIRLAKADDGAQPIRIYGPLIHAIVVLQFTLGWGALAMTRTGSESHAPIPRANDLETAHPIRVAETIITSSHHVLGALLLACVAGGLIWAAKLATKPKIR